MVPQTPHDSIFGRDFTRTTSERPTQYFDGTDANFVAQILDIHPERNFDWPDSNSAVVPRLRRGEERIMHQPKGQSEVIAPAPLCYYVLAFMKWLRALLLLGTLITSPVGVLAVTVLPASECCGAMCPMHRNEKPQHERVPCQGGSSSPRTCMCGPSQHAQIVLAQFAPEAILRTHPIVRWPARTLEAVAFNIGPVLIRPVSPPDQPPRL
jgi:hypothetical protein